MDSETRIKRLHFRSLHRGNKEMDIVFSRFIDSGFSALGANELNLFEQLLEENDVDLWNWVTGAEPPVEYNALVEMLKRANNIA